MDLLELADELRRLRLEVENLKATEKVTSVVYLGRPDVDGSWRLVRSGTDLNIERRESGSWVSKSVIPA